MDCSEEEEVFRSYGEGEETEDADADRGKEAERVTKQDKRNFYKTGRLLTRI